MNQRNRNARLFTGGIIGVPPVTTPADEYWDDVELLLDGSSLSDDLSTEQNDVFGYNNTTVSSPGAVSLGTSNGSSIPHPYGNSSVPYIDFNSGHGLQVPSAFDVSGGDWTFECWARFETGSITFDSIFSTAAGGGVQLYYTTNTTPATLILDQSTTILTHTRQITLNQWHHVALCFDYSASKMTMYIDGNGVSLTDSRWVTDVDAYFDASQHDLVFGVNRSNLAPLDGQLTDIRFTKGVIRYSANFDPPTASFPTTAPIVGRRGIGNYDTGDEYWDKVPLLLDGSSLTDDLSDAENDLTAYTNTTVAGSGAVTLGTTDGSTVPHPYGNSGVTYLDFNQDDGLAIPLTFDLSGGDWTFECWVRFNSLSQFQSIFSSAVSSGIQLGLTGGTSSFKLQFNLSSQTAVLNTATTLSSSTWYHFALTYVDSSQTMSNFVNGSLENSSSDSAWSTTTDQYLGGPNHSVSNHVVVLGVNRSNGFPLDGQLTDVRFTRGIARYTANFTPPTASLPKALVGTPLQTRGYIGAAPPGGGMLTLYDRFSDTLT